MKRLLIYLYLKFIRSDSSSAMNINLVYRKNEFFKLGTKENSGRKIDDDTVKAHIFFASI